MENLKNRASRILFPFLFENVNNESECLSVEYLPKIRIFSKYGSEIKKEEELRDDDVLFLSCFNEDFINSIAKMNYQIKQLSGLESNLKRQTTPCCGETQTGMITSCLGFSVTINSLSTKKEVTLDNLNGSLTIDEIKRMLLNSGTNKERLLGKSDYPLKFTEDFILVHKGKELKDNDEVEKLFSQNPNPTKLTVFMVLKKPVYYVKIVMEGGRMVIIDNDSINFTSHVSDLKYYMEKRLRMNLNASNKELILMWNQEKMMGSECLGNAFPSKSTLSLTFI